MPFAPGTTAQPVNYTNLHTRVPRRAVILHTNGGGCTDGSLAGWWRQVAGRGEHVGAQYQVAFDGRVFGYVDPSLVVYHAFSASEWAIGIETQDDGNPGTPWAEAQMRAIAGIIRFHGVPATALTGPDPGDGVGFHSQFPAWNQSGHDCVGHVRQAQIPHVLSLVAPHPAATPSWYRRVLYAERPGRLLHGDDVTVVQRAVGVTADGFYGDQTAAAVRRYQVRHGLTADSAVGPQTARTIGDVK